MKTDKRKILLGTVRSEISDRMIGRYDIVNCLSLLYLSEYAKTDPTISGNYDGSLPPNQKQMNKKASKQRRRGVKRHENVDMNIETNIFYNSY